MMTIARTSSCGNRGAVVTLEVNDVCTSFRAFEVVVW